MSRDEHRTRELARIRNEQYRARQLRKAEGALLELARNTGLELAEIRELLRAGRKPEDLQFLTEKKARR